MKIGGEATEGFWILSAAALSVVVLYAPQPLLPLLASLYEVNEPTAGLVMTATMLPLALAPLSYGYLLGYIPPQSLLKISLLLLALLTALTGLAQTFTQLLLIRFVQGLVIPSSLTAIMAFLAQPGKSPSQLQQGMSLYVTATISGGFLGRLLSGVSSSFMDWRLFFLLVAAGLGVCCVMITAERDGGSPKENASSAGNRYSSLRAALTSTPVYLAIFLLFFVFCGTLNYLPFRIVDLTGTRSELLAGIMYCGYVTGMMTSMGAGRILALAGSEARVMIGGYLLFVLMLTAMLVPDLETLFFLLFPFCGAMFLVHSIATAVVNRNAEGNRGVASALYVSSYYSGGVLGTYLPGFLFKNQGWGVMITTLALCGLIGTGFLVFYFRKRGGCLV